VQITNTTDISLALAVWLLHDEYDYINEPNYISATGLMKPIRHIILPSRVTEVGKLPDVGDFTARALGHSMHDSIEKSWKNGNHVKALRKLGYPADVIERVKINPTDDEVRGSNSIIPIYLEQRAFREFEGYKIGGKYDMVTDGIVQDTKSTSAYTWVYGGRDDDYRLQGSLYRWIDASQSMPKITEDFMRVNFIFTDWQKGLARSNPKYPQKRIEYKEIALLSLKETGDWVRNKLSQIKRYQSAPENQIPECTDEELWLSDPKFKYYADASKTSGKSTKNFDDMNSARIHQAEKGGKGVILTVVGEPKRCSYCDAFSSCTQKDRYFKT
jgi:hypothetical protein